MFYYIRLISYFSSFYKEKSKFHSKILVYIHYKFLDSEEVMILYISENFNYKSNYVIISKKYSSKYDDRYTC